MQKSKLKETESELADREEEVAELLETKKKLGYKNRELTMQVQDFDKIKEELEDKLEASKENLADLTKIY
jgi:predicted RNase H-like nuclease (RuvC/YqgF family)